MNQRQVEDAIVKVLDPDKIMNTKELEVAVGNLGRGSRVTFFKALKNLKTRGNGAVLAWSQGEGNEVIITLAKNHSLLDRFKNPKSRLEQILLDQSQKMVQEILDWDRDIKVEKNAHHETGLLVRASCHRLFAVVLEVERRRGIHFDRPWSSKDPDTDTDARILPFRIGPNDPGHSAIPTTAEWLIFYLGVVDRLEQ